MLALGDLHSLDTADIYYDFLSFRSFQYELRSLLRVAEEQQTELVYCSLGQFDRQLRNLKEHHWGYNTND